MVRDLRQRLQRRLGLADALTVLIYDSKATCATGTPGPSRECRISYTCSAGACTRTAAEADGSSPERPRP